MALHPGWKAYIWNNIQEIDADPSGLFTGIKDDFLKQINEKKLQSNHSGTIENFNRRADDQ